MPVTEPTAVQAPARGIDPKALLSIRDLELRARVVVEGLWSGLHRSPYTGFSVEFTEYRQYAPGDDLRYLDWRVLARTDRVFLKKFEDETNLRCLLLVDTSRSMAFGSLGWTKAEYARTLAATFAMFLNQQRDVVGLGLFDKELYDYQPPRWRPGHLHRLLTMLEKEPAGRESNLGKAFDEAALLLHRRSLVFVLSDFLEPVPEWEQALNRLVAAGHDVRAVQILDPAEVTLEFGQAARWEDMESGRVVYVDPTAARAGYQARFEAHNTQLRAALEQHGIARQQALTNQPLDLTMFELLRAGRARPVARRRRHL